MDNVEIAQDSLEHAHGGHEAHAAHAPPPRGTRRAAVLVAVFASIAVVIEMSANDAQTEYLARTIAASDVWSEYQAKSVRRTIWSEAADALAAAAPSGAGAPAAIAHARDEAARMASDPAGDGMAQLSSRAHDDETARDRAHRRHDQLERSVRVLQIAIVLTGLYLATRIEALVLIGAVMGAGAICWWGATALGLV